MMSGTSAAIGPDRARGIADLVREASVTAAPDTTVDEARRILRGAPTEARVCRRRRFRAMPVLKGRELCGTVARDDVLKALREAADGRGLPLDASQ